MDAFSFPFRFVNQKAARLDSSSEEYLAQLIGSAIQTHPGELPLLLDFGINEPEFSTFDSDGLLNTVSSYIPSVSIDNIEQIVNADQTISISVQFSIVEEV